MSKRLAVLYAVTSSVTAEAFLRGQLRTMSALGEVGIVVGDRVADDFRVSERVQAYSIGLPRNPAPLLDARGVLKLIFLVATKRPRTAVFGTPKMGLLASIATWMCFVPRRVYVMHGLRWEGLTGWKKRLLRELDGLACRLATDVVAVSPSVRLKVVRELRISADKVRVLHHGSANGIDSERFVPTKTDKARASLGVPAGAVVYAFVGRLTRDKGICELPDVWAAIQALVPRAHLVIVGQPEPVDAEDQKAIDRLLVAPGITLCPASSEIERYLGVADIHLSLSRREGMPTVVLEAASCEAPTVGYRVTGLVDAVTLRTGVLVEQGAVDNFIAASVGLGTDTRTRSALGKAARLRVRHEFAPADVWHAWLAFLDAGQPS